MASKENDRDSGATRPIHDPTYAPRPTGKACSVEHDEIERRSHAIEQGLEYPA